MVFLSCFYVILLPFLPSERARCCGWIFVRFSVFFQLLPLLLLAPLLTPASSMSSCARVCLCVCVCVCV